MVFIPSMCPGGGRGVVNPNQLANMMAAGAHGTRTAAFHASVTIHPGSAAPKHAHAPAAHHAHAHAHATMPVVANVPAMNPASR